MQQFKHLPAWGLMVSIGLSACNVGKTASPSPEAQIALAEGFFAALALEDVDQALSMLTPNAMLHAPYNPNGDATDAGIRSFPAAMYVKGAIGTYDNLVFEDRIYSVADSGETIWIEAEGRLKVAATGKPYENRYVFKLKLDGEKIASITEYTNVATLARDGVTAQVAE